MRTRFRILPFGLTIFALAAAPAKPAYLRYPGFYGDRIVFRGPYSGGCGHGTPACWARRPYLDTVPSPTPRAGAMARWA
jgi:hypothetical protein